MSEGMLGKAIRAKRKHKADIEAVAGRTGLATRAAPAAAAPAAKRVVSRNVAGPKITTTAAKAAAQKAAIQKRVAARVAAGRGTVVKKKRNKGARTLRGAAR